MSRSTINAAAKALLNSPNCNKAFITLIEIAHPNLETLYLCNDLTDVTHDERVYTAFPFELDLMDEEQNDLTGSKLVLGWVDSSILDLVQMVNDDGATVGAKFVVEGDWDYVQWSLDPPLSIKKATANAEKATFDLGLRSLETEEVPVWGKTPTTHQGLWANR